MPTRAFPGMIDVPPAPPAPGGWEGGSGGPGESRRVSLTGMIVFLCSVGMVFAAFTSIFASLRFSAQDWVEIPKPGILWANTAAILLSSTSLDRSRLALRKHNRTRFNLWWTAAALLGLVFLAGQAMAWMRLRELGVFADTSQSGSLFYILTAAHAVHLAAGLAALIYVDVQAWRLCLGPAKRTLIDVTALFWHFLTGIWLYLMVLIYCWG